MTREYIRFDKEEFDRVDKKTREALIKVYKRLNPRHIFEENTDQHGVDLIIKDRDGKPLAYIEGEHTDTWIGKDFPYEEVRMFERKRHYVYGMDACSHYNCHAKAPLSCKNLPYGPLPVYISVVNKDYTRVLTYKANEAEKADSRYVPSRNGLEKMYFVPLKICVFNNI